VEERPRPTSNHVHREELLPAPPIGRALAAAGGAAFAGAVVWALVAIYAHVEIGYIAWGIGALIGFAMVRAGGHGQMLAVCAAMLAVLSIGTGRYAMYRWALDDGDRLALTARGDVRQALNSEWHSKVRRHARIWHELGPNPDDEAVEDFALDQFYEVDSAAEFRERFAPRLIWFHENDPTLDEWRDYEAANLASKLGEQARRAADLREQVSFVEYLRGALSPLDLLFAGLGLVTAFGLVSRHTINMRVEAQRQIRAELELDAAEGRAAR